MNDDTGFHIVMGLLFVYFVGQLIWTFTRKPKYVPTPEEIERRKAEREFEAEKQRLLERKFFSDLRAQRTGGAASPRSFIDIALNILINSVVLIGVFGLKWTVGTGLALYWVETVIGGVAVMIAMMTWRRIHAGESEQPRTSVTELALTEVVFNAAHLVFLFFFLKVMMPRYAPSQAFERQSFVQGTIVIAILVVIKLAVMLMLVISMPAVEIQKRSMQTMQRVGVLHLTIIFGMFAAALFGGVRPFFAVFSVMKFFV